VSALVAGDDYSHDEALNAAWADPDAVVFPANTAEVSAVLSFANERGIPITARGAGKRFGVSFEVGAGALCVDARMTAGQARNIATALLAAATAVDGTQGGVE